MSNDEINKIIQNISSNISSDISNLTNVSDNNEIMKHANEISAKIISSLDFENINSDDIIQIVNILTAELKENNNNNNENI